MNLILGIDPGVSGGVAKLSPDLKIVDALAFSRATPTEIKNLILASKKYIKKAYIEQVHSMPLQGVRSVFTFGQNYGWWQGLLIGLEIPHERVYPLKWQTALSCRTGGDKNISKARAQELFPKMKITHAIADALLIAEYGRRKELPSMTIDEL